MSMSKQLEDRVVLVGVGGPTCSGKTTLAKHLRSILPNSIIIHQDDFAPPETLVPIHPVHNVADWDSPRGAIDWPRFRAFLRGVKEKGMIPPDHRSHDHLNEQKNIPISDTAFQEFRARFQEIEHEQQRKGIRIIWGLVDGFLLYWDKEVIDHLDVRVFLRVPHDILRNRRNERNAYHTAGENILLWHPSMLSDSLLLSRSSSLMSRDQPPRIFSIPAPSVHRYRFGAQTYPEGSLWYDPPMYWEKIVYPAYIETHRGMFENGDVENGKPTRERVGDLVVIEPAQEGAEMSMDDIVQVCCDPLAHAVVDVAYFTGRL